MIFPRVENALGLFFKTFLILQRWIITENIWNFHSIGQKKKIIQPWTSQFSLPYSTTFIKFQIKCLILQLSHSFLSHYECLVLSVLRKQKRKTREIPIKNFFALTTWGREEKVCAEGYNEISIKSLCSWYVL